MYRPSFELKWPRPCGGSGEQRVRARADRRGELHAPREQRAGRQPAARYVTAKGDPDGPGPIEPFTAEGRVTCLRVSGNRASIKWRFDKATGSAAQFGGVQTFVEDNGSPRRGEPADRAALDPPQPAATFEATATQCDDPATRATYERLNRGNVTVGDATVR